MNWRGKAAVVPDVTFVEEVLPVPRAVRTEIGTAPDPVELCGEIWKAWMAG